MRLCRHCRPAECGQIHADEPPDRPEDQHHLEKAQTTRHRVTGIQTTDKAQYIFVDTPGFQTRHRNALNEALNRSVKDSLSDVDCVLFVLEAGRLSDADREVIALLPAHRPVILVVNKADRLKDKADMANFLLKASAEFNFTEIVSVSAKHGHRLDTLLKVVEPHLPQSVPLYPEDMVTDKNERFLAAELVREKLFRYLGEELPYSMNVEIEKFEIEGNLRRIYAAVLVDKPGQKAILIGRDGERMKKSPPKRAPIWKNCSTARCFWKSGSRSRAAGPTTCAS